MEYLISQYIEPVEDNAQDLNGITIFKCTISLLDRFLELVLPIIIAGDFVVKIPKGLKYVFVSYEHSNRIWKPSPQFIVDYPLGIQQ